MRQYTKFLIDNFNIEMLQIDLAELSSMHRVVYMPSKEEQKTWSTQVKVPKNLFVGVYRVREDYYNVFELYHDPDLIPPTIFVGTDVLVHKVQGDYGYVRDLHTLKEYRVHKKLFRMLGDRDRYCPNPATTPGCLDRRDFDSLPFTGSTEDSRGICISIKAESAKYKIHIKVPTALSGVKRKPLVTKDLPEGVRIALLFVWMLRGYLTTEELVLFNSTFDIDIEDTFFTHRLIRNIY